MAGPTKYSGVQVNRAGDQLRRDNLILNQEEFSAVLDVISYWRSEHDEPLKVSFLTLQDVVARIDRRAIFGKRLKRVASISSKLRRFPEMDLKNMQDIGGCRAILTNQKKLQQASRALKLLPEFQWPNPKFRLKDYIANPKPDGYRSIHIVGNFSAIPGETRRIEVQLRTYIQHYWATALEIVDLFTHQALKSNQGDDEWRNFFRSASEQFAEMDEIHLFETMSPASKQIAYRARLRKHPRLQETADAVKRCSKKLRVVDKLEAYAGSLVILDDQLKTQQAPGFALLKIDLKAKTVAAQPFAFTDSKVAETRYIELESETAKSENVVVALVSSTAIGGIKEAYPNYFADSSQFLLHLRLILEA